MTVKRAKGERDPARTRQQLLDAGVRLFAARGFDGTTADELAAAAGVNKAMISYHFAGKEGLYQAILADAFAFAAGRLEEVRDGGGTAPDKLGQYIDTFARLQIERPQFAAMMVREVLSGGRFVDDSLMPFFLTVFSTVRSIVQQGIEEGVFRPADPVMTHLGILGSMVFFFTTEPFRRRLMDEGRLPFAVAPDPQQYVAHVKDMAQRALAVPRPASTSDHQEPPR